MQGFSFQTLLLRSEDVSGVQTNPGRRMLIMHWLLTYITKRSNTMSNLRQEFLCTSYLKPTKLNIISYVLVECHYFQFIEWMRLSFRGTLVHRVERGGASLPYQNILSAIA